MGIHESPIVQFLHMVPGVLNVRCSMNVQMCLPDDGGVVTSVTDVSDMGRTMTVGSIPVMPYPVLVNI